LKLWYVYVSLVRGEAIQPFVRQVPELIFFSFLPLQPENVKSLLISSSSIPKLQDRESLLKDVTEQVGKAKDEVDRLKPEWIEGARRAEE